MARAVQTMSGSRARRHASDSHFVVNILNHGLDQVFSAPHLAQGIKGREHLGLFHQPAGIERSATSRPAQNTGSLQPFWMSTQDTDHLKVAAGQGVFEVLPREQKLSRGNVIVLRRRVSV